MKVISKIIENKSNGQMLVYIPKRHKQLFKKDDMVIIKKIDE